MMKKILLGTTAIVGVALATSAWAAGPELSLSGFAKFEMDFVDQDSTAMSKGYRFEIDDFEIDFKAEATADNGLTYGAKLEMQFANGGTLGSDSNDDRTDEASIYLSGNWGTLILGNDDGADNVYQVAGYGILGGMGGWDGENWFTQPRGASYIVTSSLAGNSSDATKVSYFTPSFSGFSVGASWTPDAGHFGGAGLSADDGDGENILSTSAKYEGSFSDVGVAVSAAYITGDYESNDADGVATREANDISAWSIGAKVTYAGFALAGSYNDHGDTGVLKSDEANGADAGYWWDVALSYKTGPYSVGVGYFSSEKQISNTQENSVDYFALTGGWNVAPGLDFYAEYDYVEMDDGLAATANDNEANVFMVGTKVSF